MFGYRRDARSSAIRWMLFPGVIRFLPIRADRRARTYRELPAATAANMDADNCDALLGLVPERAGAVDTGRMFDTGDTAFAAPLLHPVPEHGFYFGLVRSCPRVPDIRIHRFYHVL